MFKLIVIKNIPLFCIGILFFLTQQCTAVNISNKQKNINNSSNIKDEVDLNLPVKLFFRDHNYRDELASVQCYRKGFEQSPAIIELNSSDKVILKFDDLSGERNTFNVRLIHCDAKWNPSPIESFEYMEGFEEDELTNAESSFNTFHDYVHYQYEFPNDQLKVNIAGNYLLVLYDGELDNLVLTRRIRIFKPLTIINGKTTRPGIPKYIYYNQALHLELNTMNYTIIDPYDKMTLVIEQNNRWDKVIDDLKPSFISNETYTYIHQDGNHFSGGKEFRSLDIRNLNFKSERIKDIVIGNPNKILLKKDEFRSYINKMEWKDLNGQFSISTNGSSNKDTEAEYNEVYFSLTSAHNIEYPDGDIYIVGAFNNWEINPNYKLRYNVNKNIYERMLLLKQGIYNYYYTFLRKGERIGDTGFVEGDSKETENDYFIYLYAQPMGQAFDELIGYTIINSVKN